MYFKYYFSGALTTIINDEYVKNYKGTISLTEDDGEGQSPPPPSTRNRNKILHIYIIPYFFVQNYIYIYSPYIVFKSLNFDL